MSSENFEHLKEVKIVAATAAAARRLQEEACSRSSVQVIR
jgi:hypothetical protein